MKNLRSGLAHSLSMAMAAAAAMGAFLSRGGPPGDLGGVATPLAPRSIVGSPPRRGQSEHKNKKKRLRTKARNKQQTKSNGRRKRRRR